MFQYPQEFLENQRDTSDNDNSNLVILHGPFSPLHIESKYSPGAKVVSLTEASSDPLTVDPQMIYYIPQTEEMGRNELFKGIKDELIRKDPDTQDVVIENLRNMLTVYGNQTYGEYQPATYSLKTKDLLNLNGQSLEGKSINPVLFMTYFLLHESGQDQSKKEIVLHPDILFFLSKGQKENFKPALTFLNSLAKDLNLKVFLENVELMNPKMQKVFNMFIDPVQLASLLNGYENIGITIDIKHMQNHFDKRSISNCVFSVINNIDSKKVLIHSRLGQEVEYSDIYRKCISQGIPWVVED